MSWLCKLFCPNLLRENSFLRAENGRLVDKYNKLVTEPKPVDLSFENGQLKKEIKKLNGEIRCQKQKVIDANSATTSSAREFESINEFRLFSRENKIDEVDFDMPDYVCSDYARDTQLAALNWRGGRIINCEYERDGNSAHMLNTVVIGDKLYKFEPQTDRLWFFCNIY